MSSPSSRKRKFSESEGAKKVLVGNLAYSVETKDLRDYFENEVGNVSQAKVFDDNFGRSMGVGFVEFRNSDSARSACRKLNRQEWKTRRITVQLTDEEEIERLRRAGKENNRAKKSGVCGNKVYLMNLAYEATWKGVKDLFRDEVGGVNFVELYSDSNGRPRGCGIIEFENEEMTSKAIRKMDNFEYLGRKMIVQEALDIQRDKHGYALRKTSTGGPIKEPTPSHGPNNMGNMGPINFGETYGLAPSFLDALKIDGPLRSKLFVGNLDYDVEEKKIREVFRLAGKVVAVDLPKDKEGKSKGFAIVEYSHPVEAVQAISMLGGKKLFDRTLSVRMDRESPNDDYPSRLPEGLEGVGPGLGVNGNPLRNVVDEIIRKQSAPNAAPAPPQFNELLASAKTISELTPTLSLLAQHLKPSQPEHTIQDPANQLAKAVAEIISRQQEQNNMGVMSHLPQQDQMRGVSQPPMFDHLQDMRGQGGHPFGHQSSNQSQHGDNNFNGSQLRAGQQYNQHESRGYSSSDYATPSSSAKVDPSIGKYVTGSKQQHGSRGSSTDRGFYDSFAYGSREAQPSSGNALQNYGNNSSSRWEFSNEVKEPIRPSSNSHQDSIAVSNLPNAFGENDVYDMFRKFGRIRNIKFSRPGTCLVVFEDAPAATRALEIKSQYWDRNLEIRLC